MGKYLKDVGIPLRNITLFSKPNFVYYFTPFNLKLLKNFFHRIYPMSTTRIFILSNNGNILPLSKFRFAAGGVLLFFFFYAELENVSPYQLSFKNR